MRTLVAFLLCCASASAGVITFSEPLVPTSQANTYGAGELRVGTGSPVIENEVLRGTGAVWVFGPPEFFWFEGVDVIFPNGGWIKPRRDSNWDGVDWQFPASPEWVHFRVSLDADIRTVEIGSYTRGTLYVDNFAYSLTPVPEPASIVLAVLGVVAVLWITRPRTR